MRGAILYGPRDVRFRRAQNANHYQADRCHRPALSNLRLRVRPLAFNRARQSVRPHTAPRSSGGRLPGHGRAASY
jgi:hypothetical protein